MENNPGPPDDSDLADLDATERGFVLGLLLGAENEPGAMAANLAEPAATRCREAVQAIAELPRTERVRWIGLLAREALAPLPTGIEDVAEDILCQTLAFESPSTIRAVAEKGPPTVQQAAAAVLRHLSRTATDAGDLDGPDVLAADAVADIQRAVMTRIMPVPRVAKGASARRLGRKLATLRLPDLLAELAVAGAELLGVSLRGADDITLKRAIDRAGATWSERILGAARTNTHAASVEADKALRARARALASTTTPGDHPQRTLERLGARNLGDRLGREDPDLVVSVAQRLPPDLRRELLAAAQLKELLG